jgi:hypothetical protein
MICTANLNELLVENLIRIKGLWKKVYLFYIVPEAKKGNLTDEEKLILNSLLNAEIYYSINSSSDDLHNEEVKKYA